MVGLEDPQTYTVVILPVFKCLFRLDIFGSVQNRYIGFLTCGVKAIMLRKATKWKSLELSPLGKQ